MYIISRIALIMTVLSIGCCAKVVAVAQTISTASLSPQEEAELPLLYEFYFHHIETTDILYTKAKDAGQDVSGWRDAAQSQTGMSDEQWSALHAAAIENRAARRELDQRLAKVLRQISDARKSNLGDQHPSSLDDLIAERKRLAQLAITKFRALAGEDAYRAMNIFLLRSIHVSTPAIGPQTPTSATGASKSTSALGNSLDGPK